MAHKTGLGAGHQEAA